jgi:hypothetical protein
MPERIKFHSTPQIQGRLRATLCNSTRARGENKAAPAIPPHWTQLSLAKLQHPQAKPIS